MRRNAFALQGVFRGRSLKNQRQSSISLKRLMTNTAFDQSTEAPGIIFRGFSMAMCVCWFVGCMVGQGTPLQPASAQPSIHSQTISQTISLTLPVGAALQIALNQEVRVKRVGEAITGRVMQSVYVYDHLVIPVGTVATGRISEIAHVPGGARTLSALNADFTPAHRIAVTFDGLTLANGEHIALHANVVPGSGHVIRLVGADDRKKNAVKDAAPQKMDQVRAQWNSAMKQVEAPARTHRVVRYVVPQLPVHPQYIDAGTLYSAELTQPIEFGTEAIPSHTDSSALAPLPPGSLVHAELLTPLNSGTTQRSAAVEATISQPLVDQGHLILPVGTILRGTVLQVQPAKRMHRNGQLRISFREIVLPNGTSQSVDARLQGTQSDSADNAQLDSEGNIKSTPPKPVISRRAHPWGLPSSAAVDGMMWATRARWPVAQPASSSSAW